MNRLCDSLVLLVIAHGRHYPDQPFCPWLFGTEFVEHFFGLARTILPNFSYAEFIKMVRNVMVRQRILLTGNIKQKRERDSRSGYLMEYNATLLTNQDIHNATVDLATLQIDPLVEIAYKEASAICQDLLGISAPTVTIDKPLKLAVMGALSQGHKESGTTTDNVATNDDDSDGGSEEILEDDDLGDEEEDIPEDKVNGTECLGDLAVVSAHTTARYLALCEDLEDVAASASAGIMFGPPPPPSISSISDKRVQFCNDTHVDSGNSTSLQSQLFDNNGRLSVTRMIRERQALQAQTSTHSERTFEVIVEPNHWLKQVNEENGMKRKLMEKEVAHKLRVAQVKADLSERAKTAHEQRWKDTTKAIEKALDTPKGVVMLN